MSEESILKEKQIISVSFVHTVYCFLKVRKANGENSVQLSCIYVALFYLKMEVP